MKPIYETFHVVYARILYDVEVCVTPPRPAPRVGPDSPRYMAPDSPLRCRVIRILRDRVDVGNELLWHTRDGIQQLVELEALQKYCRGKKAKAQACKDLELIPLEQDDNGQLRLLEDSR